MEKIENLYDTVLIDPNEDLVLLDKTLVQHDSNLIKFIYAICCFDYENLPVPLTRIEEFANALITGEIPNIEPQSRSEQFFKAILTGDISTLPDPQSRGEVLLDKIARGNDDLSDIEPIQSRYELLLAYLIKNGGSLPNLTYVFYQFQETAATFQNTKEKPYKSLSIKGQTYQNILPEPTTPVLTNNAEMFSVDEGLDETIEIVDGVAKSAILTGNTLVNIVNGISLGTGATETDNSYVLTQTDSVEELRVVLESSLIELNKDYTFIYYIQEKTTTKEQSLVVKNLSYLVPGNNAVITQNIGWNKVKFNVSSFGSNPRLNIAISSSEENGVYVKFAKDKFALLSGDWTQKELPFDTINYGMQSVKMPVLTTTGKNLFDKDKANYIGAWLGANGNINALDRIKLYYVECKPNTTYTISKTSGKYFRFAYGNNIPKTGELASSVIVGDTKSSLRITTNDVAKYLYFNVYDNTQDTLSEEEILNTVQLEASNSATSYEPYKSNILTAKEDVILRGIGNVKDTLDISTGEKVERIGEVVLDGSEDEKWTTSLNSVGVKRFTPNITIGANTITLKCICDKYVNSNTTTNTKTENCFRVESNDKIYIIDTNYDDVESFKLHLQSNPIKIQYELAEKSIKTVDLSVVDQDTNATDLHFFKDGHIIQSSGADTSLIPTLDYQAKTSNSYVMDLMKSNTQYTMKATSASETFTIDGTSYDAVTNGTFTSPSSITNKLLTMSNTTNEEVMIIEGDVTDKTIPYFEGIKSAFEGEDKIEVLSTGKNLVDLSKGYYFASESDFTVSNNTVSIKGKNSWTRFMIPVYLKANTRYTLTCNTSNEEGDITIRKKSDGSGESQSGSFLNTWGDGVYYVSLNTKSYVGWIHFSNIQLIEDSEDHLQYEPYKSNKTKIPLLAPLRSINEEIRDEIEIDLSNKKAVITQRIELDDATNEYIQLENPIVEEVDIVVTDQDGNEIPKPKSYDEVTHFSINSLIPPIVEVEVQTSNQEDLETLSDTIDEIENQQDKLMTTSEEQEDGVQSVMLGLTEIFEESEEV